MENFKPDPEFWKKSTYSTLWRKHRNNVQLLVSTLITKFPKLDGCIKEGHGAKTDEWLKIPPDKKNEPDLDLYSDYNCFCHIEVSGSDKVKMPNTLWIRPAKINFAKNSTNPHFFYMVYPNETRVIEAKKAEKYIDKIKVVYIKTNPTTKKKIPEKYCEIPYEATEAVEYLYDFIQKKLS